MNKEELFKLTEDVKVIVKEAGEFALKHQQNVNRIKDKEKGDYATNIDVECEKMIIEKLKNISQFPVYSEEQNLIPESKIYWVVDPIDGTKHYYRQLPLWSINVALFDSELNETQIGVVYFPKINDLFSAYKDGGSYRNNLPIQPSKNSRCDEAIIDVAPPNISRGLWGKEIYNELQKKVYRLRSWGIAASLCYVACGSFDAFVDLCGTTRDYDILAALLIAKEAGCKVVEFDHDKPIDKRIIKVTNGLLEL